MSINIRYPKISGLTEKEQLTQIKSYLHQLVEQLNYALPTIGNGTTQSTSNSEQGSEMSYYEMRTMLVIELQRLEGKIDQITKTIHNDVDEVATQVAEKLSFTLDEEGNLYYELEE